MSNDDKISENFSFQGAGLFLPLLEKFKFYQEFFRPGNIWQTKKQKHWNHEKAILHWAYSERHQHLGSALATETFKREYGLNGNGIRLSTKNASKLAEEMRECNGNMIEPIMGNLVIKGLADIITRYKDVNPNDHRNYVVHSIVINRRGLLVGELVAEEEKGGGLWKYKFLKLIISMFVFVLLLAVFTTAINQIFDFDQKVGISIDAISSVLAGNLIYQILSGIFALIVAVSLWKKL